MEYYTYAYLREDRTPFYIGKGKGNRAFRSHIRNNKIWLKPNPKKVLFLKTGLSAEDAVKHEKYMIFVYGRIDLGTGILHNLTDGGEGTSSFKRKHSIKTKQKIRKSRTGQKLSETQRQKRSQNQIGKKWWSNGVQDKFCVEKPGLEWYNGRVNGKRTKNC
jgi:hypothetical protein